jgi:hypothetical protein
MKYICCTMGVLFPTNNKADRRSPSQSIDPVLSKVPGFSCKLGISDMVFAFFFYLKLNSGIGTSGMGLPLALKVL